MPLLEIEQLNEHQFIGYWNVVESIEGLSVGFNFDIEEDNSLITHPTKQMEWLATRILMKCILDFTNLDYHGILKDEFGKPWLKDSEYYISVSHCFPMVVVILDTEHPVGIDLERSRKQIDKIAPRFLSSDEMAFSTSTDHHLIMWAVKETLYKLHGRKSLVFREQLFIESFPAEREGSIIGRIIDKTTEVHKMYYRFIFDNEYVLVHSIR